MPPAFGLQEQFDEGGVEWTQPGSRRRLRAGSERLQDLHEQVQILDIWQRHHAHQGECRSSRLPRVSSAALKMNVCAAAEPASTAQRQRPAGRSARRHHAAAVLRHLHGERLGRDADLQLLPVTCAASRGRADRLQLQALLLLGDDHPQHAVCRITLGRERLLSGTDAFCGYLRCNYSVITYSVTKCVRFYRSAQSCSLEQHWHRTDVEFLFIYSQMCMLACCSCCCASEEVGLKHGSLRPLRETLAGRWFATATSRASCRGGSDVHTRTSLESTPESGTTSAGSRTSSKTNENGQMRNKGQVFL